jgi:hypothetical protein
MLPFDLLPFDMLPDYEYIHQFFFSVYFIRSKYRGPTQSEFPTGGG